MGKSVTKTYTRGGHISSLENRHLSFGRLNGKVLKNEKYTAWTDTSTGHVSHEALVIFIGKTGYGKSTTVNSIFGKNIMRTSDVSACTRECNSIDYEISKNNYVSFADLPGIGEDAAKDSEYLDLYRSFIDLSTTIIYILRADTRDYSIDESAFRKLFSDPAQKSKVVIGLNCCDKIEPINRKQCFGPTAEQEKNINGKITFLREKFKPKNKIVPYSAATGWNINLLIDEMILATLRIDNLA